MYDVIILAAGKLEKDLKEIEHVETKAYLSLKNKIMIEYVINALREVPQVTRIIAAVPSNNIPNGFDYMVDAICLGGKGMMDSLKSAIALCKTEYVLVLPCDVPLISPESITDFLNSCSSRQAAFYYSFVSKSDSEKTYPNLKHTYVKLKDGVFCGGSLVLMKRSEFEKGETLFRKLSESRKNIFGLASKLGLPIILKFLTNNLTVAELEKRASSMLSSQFAGIQSNYAETAFNVDNAETFKRAQQIIEAL